MAVNVRIPVISTEYVRVQVTATKNGQTYNPTGDTVYFQYTTVNSEPSAAAPGASWTAGAWETVGSTYIALGLVGSNGGVSLSVGTYAIWVQVGDSPEQPARNAGSLQVY